LKNRDKSFKTSTLIQKKNINWQFQNHSKMKLAELNKINADSAFRASRMLPLRNILLLLTIGGSAIVLFWQLFDRYYLSENQPVLFWLRIATIAAYGLNLFAAVIRKTDHAYKQHLTAGFYFGTMFCTLLAMFTGASQSPYWFGLFFILIGWFVLVPFTYRELIIHSILFFFLFLAGLFIQTKFQLIDYEIAKIIFLYSGTLFIGFYAAFMRNRAEATAFLTNRELQNKNTELKKYLQVLEQAPGSVLIMDTKMNFEYINPIFTQLSGYTEEELLHKNINDTIYKGKTPDSRADVAQALRNGEKWQGELLTYHKTGKNYWANTIAAPYKDESGKIEGYIIIQQDITEHKNMELALRESEQLYRTLIEKSLNGVALTANRRFALVNQAFCNILGYSMEEIMEIQPESLLAPEDRERILAIHDKRMLGEVETMSYDAKFVHKSGKRLTVEMSSTTVHVDGQNASFVTMRDITEKNALKEALEQSESKYKTLVENSQDGILIIRDDKVLFANNTISKILGYSADEFYQMSSVTMLHPDDRHKAAKIAEKRHKQDFSTISKNFRMIAKNGAVRECETSSTLIEFDGQWASFFTLKDITESKRIQAELRENEDKYQQLFAAESDAIFMIDADTGEILDANPATTSIYGYSHDELLLMKNTDVSAEPDKTTEATHKQISLVPVRYHKKKDGTVFPVELSAGFTKLGNRNIQIVTSRDITERIQSQEALSKSEQKYRELADLLPQTVYELDLQGQITFMNQAGINAFGKVLSSDNLSALDFIVPEDHERLISNMQRSMQGQKNSSGNEYTAKRADGSRYPIVVYGAPVYTNGTLTGTRGIIIDISERKAMENALRESESKYKTLIENSQDGIFAIIGDKVHFVNSTFCKMLGYSAEEIYNRPAINLVIPEDRQKGSEISRRRMNGDWSTVNGIFHFLAKDGSVKECDTFSSVLELNGQIVSYLTVHDLTETRRMQEQLQLSEEKYRTVIEKATDGIVITQQGKLKFVNSRMCEMLQFEQEELIDLPFLNLVLEEDHKVMMDYHKRRMAGEDFTTLYRSHIKRKDGSVLTVELNSRTSAYSGSPAAFIIIRDISDRVKIENELQTAKQNLEMLNRDLEQRVIESSESLTEARTQLINLQKENLQSQFDVLKQQVNPHFLFNSLNVLTSLIKLEPDLAEKFSEHLSKVYRYVLENKDNELVDLNTELIFLDAYIFLLNIRFVNKLHVDINIPDSKRSYQVIPLAMQLLIENAIKHNIMSKSNPLQIDIFIDKNNYLNIVNNLQERPSQIISTGVGLKNIQNRYLLLNNTQPVFEKTKTHFIAKVPLVKID
jgi:PAS domain S-box-containing protein